MLITQQKVVFLGGNIPAFFSSHKPVVFLQPKAFWCNSSQDALHAFDDANPAKWITGKKPFHFQVVAQKAIG